MPQVRERDISPKSLFKRRRTAVIVVPPVEELDVVGPMQVFSAANRLTGNSVYAVEIATNADDLKAAGEGGLHGGSAYAKRVDCVLRAVFHSFGEPEDVLGPRESQLERYISEHAVAL